jgi:cell wall-associated NlpC family hydrolase
MTRCHASTAQLPRLQLQRCRISGLARAILPVTCLLALGWLPACSAPKRVYQQPPPTATGQRSEPDDTAADIQVVPPEETATDPYQTTGMQVASLAMAQIGRPYRYGGHSPAGFDCSGLTMYVYGLVDILLPRTAADQARRGRPVSLAAAEPGDLLFFHIDGGSVSHVGIFVGDGMFVHAPNSGQVVQQEKVTHTWWRQRLVDVRRIVP